MYTSFTLKFSRYFHLSRQTPYRCTNRNKPGIINAEKNNSGNSPVGSDNGQPLQVNTVESGNPTNGVDAESQLKTLLSTAVNSGNADKTGGPFVPQVVTTKSGNPTAAIQINANDGSKFASVYLMTVFAIFVSFVSFMLNSTLINVIH
mgnify:CR=1 FL=1